MNPSVVTESHFDPQRIGQWSSPTSYAVSRDGIQAYAAATNDTIAAHAAGDLAPPVFAVVPAFTQLISVVMEPVPAEFMLRILHGEQDIRIHRPIVPGDELTSRGQVTGIHGKSSGVVVTSLVETRDAGGTLVNEQRFAGFFRGATWPHEAGERFPAHELSPVVAETTPRETVGQRFDHDQTWRYAAASGDLMPIHTDEEFARSVGQPGVIIHGLCTMAFTSRAVIEHACPDDPARLRRICVRFGAPAFPGELLTTRIWATGTADGHALFGFEAATGEGRTPIKDGLAEIALPTDQG